MAAEDVGLQGIGDCVYVGIVYVLKSLVITLSPSCKWTQKNKMYSKQQQLESSAYDTEMCWL